MPLFIGEKEINFFDSITKELVQEIVEQEIFYYAISEKHTKVHDVYGEATEKVTYVPVKLNALVLYDAPQQTTTKFSVDKSYTAEVYLHIHELNERGLTPREGDFIKWSDLVFEIKKLTDPQIVYGQIKHKVMIKAECKIARKGQFEVLDEF